jgi:trigger factor
MATLLRKNIAPLTDTLTVTIVQEDYQKSVEASLQKFTKSANIPGFRKGMVPAGLIRKMHGQSVFQETIIKTAEQELNQYIAKENLAIFAQPLPLTADFPTMDINHPGSYEFSFEVGLKPSFDLHLENIEATRYSIDVTDDMINAEIERLQIRNGNMTEPEVIQTAENVLNVRFIELDQDGNELEGGVSKDNSLLLKYFAEGTRSSFLGKKINEDVTIQLNKAFEEKELDIILADLGLTKEQAATNFKIVITKIGVVEKAPLEETLFKVAYPNQTISTAEEFTQVVKKDIIGYYEIQSRNQLHDQIYHALIENTKMEFPTDFLKRWLQVGSEKQRTPEEASKEYPIFQDQLKWNLISARLMTEYKIEVIAEDLKDFAKQQLMNYMGGQLGALGDNDQWLEDYALRMMQDRKFVEDSYLRISTEKLMLAIEGVIKVVDEKISAEKFAEKIPAHPHS